MKFQLDKDFVESYKYKKSPFGFNGLGELVYKRSYSRVKQDLTNECWYETIERVVNGCYSIQKEHVENNYTFWNEEKAQKSAKEMYDRMFQMKFLPGGRFLWAMGSPITEDKRLYMALFNCSFISTKDLDKDVSLPFVFMLDVSCLGVGVGFDTKGEEKVLIHKINKELEPINHTIKDTREDWGNSLRVLLETRLGNGKDVGRKVIFDYSNIRPKGVPLKTFGGISSGHESLMLMHKDINKVIDCEINKGKTLISARLIVDIANLIGKCVVSGGIRRSAYLALGNNNNEEFLDLKNYDKNPERFEYGWSSNNSIIGKVGMDYSTIAEKIKHNGEPGIFWLDNARDYGRMCEPKNYKDKDVLGTNPCCEVSLEHAELCNLVEIFPHRNKDIGDFLTTIKYAFLLAKTATLVKTHWDITNKVILKNRRIGVSMSGIAQFLSDNNLDTFKHFMESGYEKLNYYDQLYSDWFAVPKSKKLSCIKPSGSISLLAGATPGMHFPESNYYIRRVRLQENSRLLPQLKDMGLKIEKDVVQPNTMVVEFPISLGDKIKTLDNVTMWEQLLLNSFIQKYWTDQQNSCTITFKPETEGNFIETALDYFQYDLKGISFLPKMNLANSYPQMPYEKITKEEYNEMYSKLNLVKLKNGLDFVETNDENSIPDLYCTADKCSFIL